MALNVLLHVITSGGRSIQIIYLNSKHMKIAILLLYKSCILHFTKAKVLIMQNGLCQSYIIILLDRYY